MRSALVKVFIPITVFLVLLQNPRQAAAEDALDITARFQAALDETMENEDLYELSASMQFEFEVTDKFDTVLELEADRFEVEVEELSFKYKPGDYLHLLAGLFENSLTLDEYIPAHDRIFGTKSLISNLIETQGYISDSVGARVYKKYKKGTLPIAYFMETSFIPAHTEMQVDAGFLYHFGGKDSYAGILAGYLPYFAHEFWLGERSRYQTHNFLVDLIFADHEQRLVYGLEATLASNLLDPIGLISYPGDGERSYFLGGDAYIGFSLELGQSEWLPALRATLLFPELTVMETYQVEIRWGNFFRFGKAVLLHVDAGLGILTRYEGSTLYTRLDPLYALKFMVRI
jgi:hypothetical protein